MQRTTTARRTQFSSCDECRRSRVGCDASSRRVESGNENAECTRCVKRRKQCTFKWMRNAKTPHASGTNVRNRRSSRLSSAVTTPGATTEVVSEYIIPQPSPGTFQDWTSSCELPLIAQLDSQPGEQELALSPDGSTSTRSISEILKPLDSQWLQTIYNEGFNAVFGSWMGCYGCPFLLGENSPAEPHVNIAKNCIKLDKWMREASADPTTPSTLRSDHQDTRDAVIDQSLKNTIAAFSARWLPITASETQVTEYHRAVAQSYWRRARRDMLRVTNRPSYRSMLSLFLFALTPIPYGISEEEETDGISGQACVHAALQQIQTLRARHRNLQFSGSKVSPTVKRSATATSPEGVGTSEFITAESIAYWAALTFDTSASLTLNCKPFLSSGLFGFESELPWRLVKSASKMFHETVQGWRGDGTLDMTDERANEVISSGTGWKLLLWKLTAVFKEALRDGHDEAEVEKSYTAVMAAMQEFDTTFRPPLAACQSRMPFLGQQVKLRWYSLMLHYHLSILILADTIEAVDRDDLLVTFAQAISGAEAAVMNTLVFGLQNTFMLGVEGIQKESGHPIGATASFPIVSIDPYPHHVVASVQLMHKAIDRDAAVGKISEATCSNLVSILEQVLKHLPANSKSVQAARERFSLDSTSEDIATPHQDLTQYYMLDV